MPIIRTTKPLRGRDPKDHYPTDPRIVRAALRRYGPAPGYPGPRDPSFTILDTGAGSGVWGAVARQFYPAAGIGAVDISPRPVDLPWGIYHEWRQEDYLTAPYGGGGFGMVIGNPPFCLAERFVRKSIHLLADGGLLIYLLRLYFAGSQKRARGLFAEFPPHVIATLVGRPSWTQNNKTDADEYAIWVWRKGYAGRTAHDWLEWKQAAGWVPPPLHLPPEALDLPEDGIAPPPQKPDRTPEERAAAAPRQEQLILL